jgi:hypothetical protein
MALAEGDDTAAALKQESVTPPPVQFSDALAKPDIAKSASAVQCEGRFILGKYYRLERPDSVLLGFDN